MKVEFISFRDGVVLYDIHDGIKIKIATMHFLREDWPWYVFIVDYVKEGYYLRLENYMMTENDNFVFENSKKEIIHDSAFFMSVHKKENVIYASLRDCRC